MTEAQVEGALRTLVEEAPDAVVISDREGIIRFWNRGAESIFGYLSSEAVGASLDLVIPEKLRARHWEGYRRVMATGESRYKTGLLSAPGIRKGGDRVSLEFSMVLFRDDAGTPCGCAAIMRDVTERWLKEKALREKVMALEGKEAGS